MCEIFFYILKIAKLNNRFSFSSKNIKKIESLLEKIGRAHV